jgi:hypothetical protein
VDLGNSTNDDEMNVILGDKDDDSEVDGAIVYIDACVWQDIG